MAVGRGGHRPEQTDPLCKPGTRPGLRRKAKKGEKSSWFSHLVLDGRISLLEADDGAILNFLCEVKARSPCRQVVYFL